MTKIVQSTLASYLFSGGRDWARRSAGRLSLRNSRQAEFSWDAPPAKPRPSPGVESGGTDLFPGRTPLIAYFVPAPLKIALDVFELDLFAPEARGGLPAQAITRLVVLERPPGLI